MNLTRDQKKRSIDSTSESDDKQSGKIHNIASKKSVKKGNQSAKVEKPSITDILKKASEKELDFTFTPMLATLVDVPFNDVGWEYEIKWDGYRALAFINGEESELKSRNKISFNTKFSPVYQAIKNWPVNAVVDGEIVVVNEKGISDFGSLQNWRSKTDGELLFYVFDLLWLNGKNLTGLPLSERKAVLQSIFPDEGLIRNGYSVESDGISFFEAAKKLGLEGIMAKKSDSLYLPGMRTKDWLKIKIHRRQEVVIGGYTKNKGTSKLFSSLLLGVYEGNELRYVGKVGTGFKDKQQKEMLEIFKPLTINKTPFNIMPEYNKPNGYRPNPVANAIWLQPTVVCEVSFTEVTSDGVFRHPSFEGLREDKKAKEVVREIEKPVGELIKNG